MRKYRRSSAATLFLIASWFLVSIALWNMPGIEKFSLDELTKYFGISRLRAHRALEDARATYELFVKLINY